LKSRGRVKAVVIVDRVQFHQTKFLARDIDALASFYEEALGCETVVPVQKIDDEEVARGIGVPGADVTLTILRLPGRGPHGPVLELYSLSGGDQATWAHEPGQGQIAFEVEDLDRAVAEFKDAGGAELGEIVEWEAPSGSRARFVYLRDPEGNIVDLFARAD
jgi:catechol 2,3-dioxygenase-like lactoylglutathione lyase family enzyme